MNYVSKLFSTGAVRKTPKGVMQTMLKEMGQGPYHIIVEIGAGKGELTTALLHNNIPFDQYHAFEIDGKACNHLREEFPSITIHPTNAFEFTKQLSVTEKINLFLSSIPLSFYPREKVKAMLSEVKNLLAANGKIVIIFSAVWLIPFLKKQLPGSTVIPFVTFPPYFILSYQKKD
jgi:phospholipid N-methyltransferase